MILLLSLCYPLLVWGLWGSVDSWVLCVLPLTLFLFRMRSQSAFKLPMWVIALAVVMWCSLAIIWADTLVLTYPIIVNFVFLLVFGFSLQPNKTPIIERLARITEPDLPDSGVIYTRIVTKVWICFFVFNGLASAATLYLGDLSIWALYNGLISYLLMGTLFITEFIVRFFYRRRHSAL